MKILVVSPHPDDETLGAGGTLLKCKEEGHRIYWLNVTNMATEYGYKRQNVENRLKQIQMVNCKYNFDDYIDMKLEPANLEQYNQSELIERFKEIINKIKPEIVILPYYHDVHSDHKIVFESVYACLKPFRTTYIKKILCMEIISETDQGLSEYRFTPNIFVNISRYIDKKIEIADIYESEIMAPPFPRNNDAIKGLAAYRGATAHCLYAEAFYLVRELIY